MTVREDGSAARAQCREKTLDELIEYAIGRMADGGRLIILTPARLRSYVERETLRRLRSRTSDRPAAPVDVHSFTSFVRSVIGNHGGEAMCPTLSPFVLRAFLAREMTYCPELLREAGRTFGSVNQFATQIEELRKAGVTVGDLNDAVCMERHDTMPDGDASPAGRFTALRTLMASVERQFGRAEYALPGEVAPAVESWLRAYGATTWFLLFGFERFAPSEALAVASILKLSNLIVDEVDETCHDLLSCLNGEGTHGNRSLSAVERPSVKVRAVAIDDPTEEVRFVAAEIARLASEPHGRLSYGDVLVTARDISPYRASLATEFAYRGIPVNATPAATMIDDPMADVILGLMDPAFYRREPVAVMRVLRSGLLHGLRVPCGILQRANLIRGRWDDPLWMMSRTCWPRRTGIPCGRTHETVAPGRPDPSCGPCPPSMGSSRVLHANTVPATVPLRRILTSA